MKISTTIFLFTASLCIIDHDEGHHDQEDDRQLRHEPKLLIPDIKANGDAITYDAGNFYPHHNLYYITSQQWNLRALQALLRSGIAYLFVAAYSVKIGGGYLRFQAQNLKRIRIPH